MDALGQYNTLISFKERGWAPSVQEEQDGLTFPSSLELAMMFMDGRCFSTLVDSDENRARITQNNLAPKSHRVKVLKGVLLDANAGDSEVAQFQKDWKKKLNQILPPLTSGGIVHMDIHQMYTDWQKKGFPQRTFYHYLMKAAGGVAEESIRRSPSLTHFIT